MGEVNYAPLIDDMVWSYSRVKTFSDCPYRWYLKYIRGFHGKELFFSSYGTFMHKLIELYYRGEKTQGELVDLYLQNFRREVADGAPSQKVFSSYFTGGLNFLKTISPLPYNIVSVEKRVDFRIHGVPFVGYIDLLAEKDGELYIIDNKARALKPRSARAKPTKSDAELDTYLRQLYIYSAAVEEECKVFPKYLCFNCYRENMFIKEPFSEQAFAESGEWLLGSIETIRTESGFKPSIEYFKCAYICEMQDFCEYYELFRKNGGK